jgi:hypothetical protein
MNAAVFGFIGVIVGALLTGFKERLFRRWDDEKKSHYLAIRVCTLLDLFLYDCADVVQDDGTVRGESDRDGNFTPQARLPSLPFEELDVDWQAIPSELAYDILTLPNRVQRARRYIEGAYENDYPDWSETFRARQDEFAKLGQSAANIADRLRILADLPDRERRDWDPMDPIREQLGVIAKRPPSSSWLTGAPSEL